MYIRIINIVCGLSSYIQRSLTHDDTHCYISRESKTTRNVLWSRGLIPNYVINNIKLEEVEEFKDLGVTYDSLLLFDKHISNKVNKAYMMLGIIKRNLAHLS